MKNINNKLVYVLVALICMACGPRVTTVKTSDKDLDNYQTFAYLPNSNFDDLEKFDNDESVGKSVLNHVNRKMEMEGYKMDRSNPDLLVLINTTTDIDRTVTTEPVYATYPGYYNTGYRVSPYYSNYYYYNYNNYNDIIGYETDVNRYKEGTLVFRLVDSKSKEVIWKATATDFISKENSSQAISEYVDDLFEEFPV